MGPVRTLLVIALAAAAAAPVVAQDLVYSDDATVACVNAAPDAAARRACVGMSARACMAASPAGDTTVGIGGCLDRELTFWDDILNINYRRIRDKARAADQASAGSMAPPLAPALLAAQRTWIGYRDAVCDYEMAMWGGGTGGGPALVGCLMRMTGEQALYLDDSWLGD